MRKIGERCPPSIFCIESSAKVGEDNSLTLGRGYVTIMNVPIPKNCIACMLRGGLTRNCGRMVKKVPDERCLLKVVDIPERLKKAMIEYGTKF